MNVMDMATPVHQQRLFFSTGRRHGAAIDAVDEHGMRPALLARYRSLERLRYDFPLILVDGDAAGTRVRSLTSVIDEVLRDVAPRGAEGERLRKHVLRLEREIRTAAVGRAPARFSDLWRDCAALLARPDDPSAGEVLAHIAGKLGIDGEVVDCDAAMPARVVRHLWQAQQQRKARAFHASVARLTARLSDILRAAFLRSEAGQQPAALRGALGGSHRDLFDFDVMSRLLKRSETKGEFAPARRQRIERALATLKGQRFFADPRNEGSAPPFSFAFDDCASAASAFRERLPELADVVRAIALAELEVDGRYVEARHDAFFEHFDASDLTPDDFALFPDYLVVVADGRSAAVENGGLLELLSAGMPLKVLVETSDPIEDRSPGADRFAFGVRSMRLAYTATGLGGVFVVQGAASHLYALHSALERALAHDGAALVSVYAASATAVQPYLVAAAAMESRAFPAFVYDPKAGDNQAARFSLQGNPQPELDFPSTALEYADDEHQRVSEPLEFTIADFALAAGRYAGHFARIPREHWNDALVSVPAWLGSAASARADLLPFIWAVDNDDVLHRVLVDAHLMRIVARGRTFWRRLQEQGGIHNSHAELAVAREKAKWEAEYERTADEARSGAAPSAGIAGAPSASIDAQTAAGDAAPDTIERASDDPWIETARCPSCNECQTINDRMFKYNENKQAYIADVSAGTYRQLVEAAEACQVAIIHPGKPRDPNEPGLEELLERAKPFLA